MKQDDLINIFLVIMLFLGMFIAISSQITNVTTLDTVIDTSSFSNAVPFNITLSGGDPQILVNVSNGSVTIPATNYTDLVSSGFLTLLDNTSFDGTPTITYTNQPDAFVSGISVLLVGVVLILLVIFLIKGITKKISGKGK